MTILRYRPPFGLLWMLGVPVGVWLFGATTFPIDRNYLTFGLSIAAFCAFFWFNNAGYRIAYDDARLYMRGFGFWNRRLRWPAFHGIAFDDIALISMETDSPGPQGTRYVPGEYLEVVSARAGDEDIWIYPQAIREPDLAKLLALLHRRCPDLLPEEVTERLRDAAVIQ